MKLFFKSKGKHDVFQKNKNRKPSPAELLCKKLFLKSSSKRRKITQVSVPGRIMALEF